MSLCEQDDSKDQGLLFMNIAVNDHQDILLSAIVRAMSRAFTSTRVLTRLVYHSLLERLCA